MPAEGSAEVATIAPPAPRPRQPLVIPPLAPEPEPTAPLQTTPTPQPVETKRMQDMPDPYIKENPLRSDVRFQALIDEVTREWESKSRTPKNVGGLTIRADAERLFRRRYPDIAKDYDEQARKQDELDAASSGKI